MFTDLPPKSAKALREFKRSDSLDRLAIVPDGSELQTRAVLFERALAEEDQRRVRVEGNFILSLLAQTYTVSRPKLRVLGARPVRHWEGVQSELFGDYDFEAKRIRIWMRTAVLAKVTSYRGLLNTLLHEFCHHLDREGLGFSSSPHTRGFYTRIDQLYHLALATPPEQRRPLAWIRIGDAWRIDWMRMRTRSREQPYAYGTPEPGSAGGRN